MNEAIPMKNSLYKSDTRQIVLLGMLVILFCTIAVVNLFSAPRCYDTDMYLDIQYAVYAWENKSIFPENWVFGNQIYVLATPVLAGLFYGIVKDAVIAMGLASIVMSLLVILSFEWMLCPVIRKKEERWFGSIVFITLVLFSGDLSQKTNGWQLLFTMCSYYACYAITAFLAFGCVIRAVDGSKSGPGIITVTCLMAFAMGIQSLRQTVVMALPLLAVAFFYVFLQFIMKKRIDFRFVRISVLIFASNLLGLLIKPILNVSQVEIFGETGINSITDMISSVPQSMMTAYSLFSVDGVVSAVVIRVFLVICAAAIIMLAGQIKKTDGKGQIVLFLILCVSVIAILAVDMLTRMDVRPIYYFMLYPMVAYLTAYCVSKLGEKGKNAAVCCLAVFVLFSFTQKIPEGMRGFCEDKADTTKNISNYLVENGYSTIYSVGDDIGEDIALASGMSINAGFWFVDEPFSPVKYLCDPSIYETEADKCVYLFRGKPAWEDGEKRAKFLESELILLKYYEEEDIYLCISEEQLMNMEA